MCAGCSILFRRSEHFIFQLGFNLLRIDIFFTQEPLNMIWNRKANRSVLKFRLNTYL